MDMTPGYQQTEVGVIPDDWDVAPIGHAFDICNNLRLPISRAVRQKMAGPYPYYGPTSVQGYINEYRVEGQYALIGEDGDHFLKWRMESMTLLVSGKFNVNNHAHLIRGTQNLTAWFYYYFSHRDLTSYLTRQGAGRYKLTKRSLVNIPCALPPLAEQEAIAEALSDADTLIESLEQLIAKNRHLKQGAMQELLRPKDDWVQKQLGNTAVLKARIGWQGLTTAEYLASGDYYLVTGTDFKGGYIDWDNCHYVEEARYRQDKNIQLKQRDILVTKDGTVGKVALVKRIEKPTTLNSGVFVIRPIEDAFHPEFFYYLLCSNSFFEFLSQLCAGSTINHLYQKDFVNFVYKTPHTLSEQAGVASTLSDMDADIAALETKLAKIRYIKQGMMHNLLTGRVRLL